MLKVYNPYYDGCNQSKIFKDMPEVASDDAYCVLLTNIEPDALDLEQVYSLYRMRWQIELMFKAYKSGNSFNAGMNVNQNVIESLATLSMAKHTIKNGYASYFQETENVTMSPLRIAASSDFLANMLLSKAVGLPSFDDDNDLKFEKVVTSCYKHFTKCSLSKYNRQRGKGVWCVNKILSRPPSPDSGLSLKVA